MTTNYTDTFIAVSQDCAAVAGEDPRPGTLAAEHLRLLRDRPYQLTSDELIFAVWSDRHNISQGDREREWRAFQQKSLPCLRTSPLVKTHGWGLHHDAAGKVAAYGVETKEYRDFESDATLTHTRGMRSKKRTT